jgi:hypothetical protein
MILPIDPSNDHEIKKKFFPDKILPEDPDFSTENRPIFKSNQLIVETNIP